MNDVAYKAAAPHANPHKLHRLYDRHTQSEHRKNRQNDDDRPTRFKEARQG
ncbi:MAG: hypothetical protein AAF553_04715 [Pseudomonadota bacterium]